MNKTSAPQFSFEFFPPRTPVGETKLDAVHAELAALGPEFFSVTYGARGTTKVGTRKIVLRFKALGSTMTPHLSFGGSSEPEVEQLLEEYRAEGIDRLVVLRGDIPSDSSSTVTYRYASELVEFIRLKTGDHFHIDVACYPEIHPESSSYDADIGFFKQKVDAGANSAITQYFYNADAYFNFVENCAAIGMDIPIVPGIMPITNFANLSRFSVNCGAEIPRWISQRVMAFGEDQKSISAFGIDVVTRLCERLREGGAPGLHFYTMNQAKSVKQIWQNLGLSE
ncbi:MAG: methylenetetrahydrofolate reductase [NAD(P)H] [Gammaproteobacteria bacterium]|jgi:methylenetetrahydrofolate reductase (NADPH)|nr:methylenetetrahydrofolate reductase [NAD(P)H] [Gammaproteobacteria bacterium]MDP6097748.1 methylenetetrahydrofolate reductase [NAD(P)H] [Gammaproteobacteria bacterium]|tara:strand:- start:4817 stop:5662 length:846 start_codon:yes stop_codon:yes gene_type:complete